MYLIGPAVENHAMLIRPGQYQSTVVSRPGAPNRSGYKKSCNINQQLLTKPSYWQVGVLLHSPPKLLSKRHASGALLLVAEGLSHSSIF